ncbi:imm11 family protein [Psychromonas algicola]|uniref:imm11 family protein n=1 Tax=Psychromonas algicola TaxID=2555642 RepID=UPI0010678925|nr:DUF1629 domain-containing protein [Psychromonas sp. RZ5]TEW44564.1 hypothetical protein E2R67_14830 [Psychromonas sp. RZ5]
MSNNYFFMIATSPAFGPTVEVVDAPSVRTTKGKSIGDIEEPFRIELVVDRSAPAEGEYPPRDIHESAKFTFFSRKFIDALTSLGVENIEYFEADVLDTATNEKLDYCAVNILGRINAVDKDHSDLIMVGDNMIDVEKMVLDKSKIQDHKIFMLGEIPMLIVVHQSIKEIVEKQGLTGFRFFSEEEYEPGII